MLGLYIHNKTGKNYIVIDIVINATNDQDGQMMFLYINEEGGKFVREKQEFLSKFTKYIT